MFHIQSCPKQKCRLMAVLCGNYVNAQREERRDKRKYAFPELISSGGLEVCKLINPTLDEFRDAYKSICPNFLYLQGEQLENEEELGSLVWGTQDVSDPELLSSLICPQLPTVLYLEAQKSEKIASTLHSKGVPYVIYWNAVVSSYASSHFQHSLLSVMQSSLSHIWDAFQLAFASFRLYCIRNNYGYPVNCRTRGSNFGPLLLGDAPKVNITLPKKPKGVVTDTYDMVPDIKIHDKDVDLRLLVCGLPCPLDASLLGSLEDGLNALLNIEIRGCNLENKVSSAPLVLEAGTVPRGILSVKCDFTTCSFAYFSVLVSGSVKTCYDDHLLESHIKKELVENGYQFLRGLPGCGENEPRTWNSLAIAAGAPFYEVSMKVPAWASQVLKYLARDTCYRSLVALGIGGIAGNPVTAFDKEDADRLLFFCTRGEKNLPLRDGPVFKPPVWNAAPTRRRSIPSGDNIEGKTLKKGLNIAAMRPIPRRRWPQGLPFLGGVQDKDVAEILPSSKDNIPQETYANDGSGVDGNMAIVPSVTESFPPADPSRQRDSTYGALRDQKISLSPLAQEKHRCNRSPIISICSEGEFLADVIQYIILRGYIWLLPQGEISGFPDAILNGRRLDLFNLYREVVSRGGFSVAKGINWKGQVFSRMHNYTESHRMTGIGTALKRHYMTYLLEYELAHDDVEAECCLLCKSGAAGNWLNCSACGLWVHYDCDDRRCIRSFKDYAKTEGLEYICPPCSRLRMKKKSHESAS